jgi:uroporphyrinogen-III decarboxylase
MMTMRDRILGVVHGREVDRVPFVQYEGQVAKEEAWALLGRDNMGILRWSRVHRVEHPNCGRDDVEFERGGTRVVRTTLHTPAGDLVQERTRNPGSAVWRTTEHFVKEPTDYEALMAYFRDAVVLEDTAHFLKDRRELGEDGEPLVALERTPFQQLWIQWVDLQDLCYHMADRPQLLHECMELMGDVLRRVMEVARRAPVEFVDFPDNITAPVIGVDGFRRYCVPFYNEMAEMFGERDVPVFVHMDGDLKPLWGAIGESAVRGIDSLSPPPDNDTSPGRAHEMWPRTRLFVNFPSSVHLAPPERVHARAWELLEEAGRSGRLQIQISEDVPPSAWRTSYPQIVRAIREFAPRERP